MGGLGFDHLLVAVAAVVAVVFQAVAVAFQAVAVVASVAFPLVGFAYAVSISHHPPPPLP